MNILHGNAVVGQSGGPTAAINATLSGVIRGALNFKKEGVIPTLFGMRNGIEGLLREDLVDLTARFFGNEEELKTLEATPAAALGSCRRKLTDPEKEPETYEKLFEIFQKYDIRYFFYIGGNDSMDTVMKLSRYAKQKKYELRVIGVPKTIDNDLEFTDHTPGFGSAAKFIATTVKEVLRDISVYTVKAVTIVEIMGRDAGWLTTAAALPKLSGGIAPDLIYLPEREFDMDEFLSDVRAALERHPAVFVAVSEGIKFANGEYVGAGTQSGSVDAFGHKYLAGTGKVLEQTVKEKIGCKVRSMELSLTQRCASHVASLADISESVRVGEGAISAAVSGKTGVMMTFERADKDGYTVSVGTADINGIANKIKTVPDNFINEKGNFVTDECISYLAPLVLGELDVEYEFGMPKHIII